MIDYKNGEVSYTFKKFDEPAPTYVLTKQSARVAEGLAESNFRICPSCGQGGCISLMRWRIPMTPAAIEHSGLKTQHLTCRTVVCDSCDVQVIRILLKGKVTYFSNIPTWKVAA